MVGIGKSMNAFDERLRRHYLATDQGGQVTLDSVKSTTFLAECDGFRLPEPELLPWLRNHRLVGLDVLLCQTTGTRMAA
jgi:hypothetical protein